MLQHETWMAPKASPGQPAAAVTAGPDAGLCDRQWSRLSALSSVSPSINTQDTGKDKNINRYLSSCKETVFLSSFIKRTCLVILKVKSCRSSALCLVTQPRLRWAKHTIYSSTEKWEQVSQTESEQTGRSPPSSLMESGMGRTLQWTHPCPVEIRVANIRIYTVCPRSTRTHLKQIQKMLKNQH